MYSAFHAERYACFASAICSIERDIPHAVRSDMRGVAARERKKGVASLSDDTLFFLFLSVVTWFDYSSVVPPHAAQRAVITLSREGFG